MASSAEQTSTATTVATGQTQGSQVAVGASVAQLVTLRLDGRSVLEVDWRGQEGREVVLTA